MLDDGKVTISVEEVSLLRGVKIIFHRKNLCKVLPALLKQTEETERRRLSGFTTKVGSVHNGCVATPIRPSSPSLPLLLSPHSPRLSWDNGMILKFRISFNPLHYLNASYSLSEETLLDVNIFHIAQTIKQTTTLLSRGGAIICTLLTARQVVRRAPSFFSGSWATGMFKLQFSVGTDVLCCIEQNKSQLCPLFSGTTGSQWIKLVFLVLIVIESFVWEALTPTWFSWFNFHTTIMNTVINKCNSHRFIHNWYFSSLADSQVCLQFTIKAAENYQGILRNVCSKKKVLIPNWCTVIFSKGSTLILWNRKSCVKCRNQTHTFTT